MPFSANAASGSCITDVKPIICKYHREGWVYNNQEFDDVEQDSLTPDDLAALVLANYHAAVAAGWEDKAVNIAASAYIMAVLLGALKSSGEWRITDTPNMTNLRFGEVTFLNAFEEIAHTGSLMRFMGAVNHFSMAYVYKVNQQVYNMQKVE